MEQVYIGTTNYGRHWLSRPAAEAWFRMVRDGCPAAGITDAGRTQAEQETLFRKHYTTNYAASAKIDRRQWQGQFWYRAYQPGGKRPWPSAATPGSPQARHQWGLSLDLNGTTKAWVRANGHRYGWIKDIVRGEDWHMEYQSSRDVVLVSNPGTSVGGNLPDPSITTPTPIIPEDDMTPDQEAQLTSIKNGVDWLFARVAEIHPTIASTLPTALREQKGQQEIALAALQNITNGVVALLGRPGADVDEAALAAALVPLLSSQTLDDVALDRIAAAVQDERDRRERERLGAG